MLQILSLILASAGSATSASAMLDNPFRAPKALYYSAERASGSRLCQGPLKERQARLFDRRFGTRVLKLASAMKTSGELGWGEDDMLISTCRRYGNYAAAQRDLARALREFEKPLARMEVEYGTSTDPHSRD